MTIKLHLMDEVHILKTVDATDSLEDAFLIFSGDESAIIKEGVQ